MWGYVCAAAAVLLGIPVAVFIVFVAWLINEGAKHKPKRELFPGPPDGTGRSLFGLFREDAFVYLAQVWGKTFTLDTVVATCDPSLVRTLLLSQKHSLGRSWLYRLFAKLMPYSDGILFMEDEGWRRRHKEFIPLFAGPNIRLYTLSSFKAAVEVAEANRTDAAVPQTRVEGLVPIGFPAAAPDQGADLLQAVRAVAVRFLLGWGAGMEPDAPASIRLGASLDDYAHTCLEVLPYASRPPVLGHLTQYAKLWKIALSLRRQCDALVAARAYESKDARNGAAAAAAAAAPAPAGPAPNFVARMVAAGFSPRDIASEVNHVHGAHKAVAFTTTAALFELSTPGRGLAWRQRVRAELEAAFGKPAAGASPEALVRQAAAALPAALREAVDAGLAALPGAPAGKATSTTTEGEAAGGAAVTLPRPSELPLGWRPPERLDAAAMETALPATWCVWQETLRRHVVSMGSMRRTGEPVVHEGVTIPPNTDVNILLHAMHHLPEHWGAHANEWRPERWEPATRGSAELGPLQDHVYFPFLDGVRRCAGMHVAGMQFVVMLYVFLVIYDVQVVVPQEAPGSVTPSKGAAAASPAATAGAADVKRAEALLAGLTQYAPSTFETHAESAVVPDGNGGWKLRMRPEMFSAFDGRVPFTCKRRE